MTVQESKKWAWLRRFQKTWKGFDTGTRTLACLTGLAAGTSIALLAGAGWFRPGGHWPSLEELDHVGSWLGGVFAPTALAWTARAFFLQRDQMRAEEAKRREDLRAERVRWNAELISTAPAYTVSGDYQSDSAGNVRRAILTVTNHGAAAINARVTVTIGDRRKEFDAGDPLPVDPDDGEEPVYTGPESFFRVFYHDKGIPTGASFTVIANVAPGIISVSEEYTHLRIVSERLDGNLALSVFDHEYGSDFRRISTTPLHFEDVDQTDD